jgi:hypothetical protein
VRILGEVNAENVAILQQADLRVQEEMRKWEGYPEVWQSFAVLLPVKSVGVMGDERTYANVIAIRAVSSQDGMTADWVGPLRGPGQDLHADHQRGQGRQPGGLRHLLEAAQHHRVGIGRHPTYTTRRGDIHGRTFRHRIAF